MFYIQTFVLFMGAMLCVGHILIINMKDVVRVSAFMLAALLTIWFIKIMLNPNTGFFFICTMLITTGLLWSKFAKKTLFDAVHLSVIDVGACLICGVFAPQSFIY